MVQYGKSLRQSRRAGWENAYLDYKALKKILSELERYLEDRNANRILHSVSSLVAFDTTELVEVSSHNIEDGVEPITNGVSAKKPSLLQHRMSPCSAELGDQLSYGIEQIKERFFQDLGREIEKMSLFCLKKQGELADSIGALRFENDGSVADLFRKPEFECQDDLEQYLSVGVELLYILQFIGVNTLGVRKILKKYNKVVQSLDRPQHAYFMGSKGDIHLHHLANSQSVMAVQASLQSALVQLYHTDASLDMDSKRNLNYFRLQSIVQASHMIRRNSEIVNEPFREFIGRKAMLNLGNVDGSAMLATDNLLGFDPKVLLSYDERALDALWKVWLPQFKHWKNRRDAVANTDDWYQLNEATKDAMAFLLAEQDGWYTIGKGAMYGDQDTRHKVIRKAWGGADGWTMAINMTSALLYTVNYYIVSPTANRFSILLGFDGAYGATLIGASSFSAIFAAFLYSFWYTKATFKSSLVFSTICALLGNLLYGFAISFRSMGMALTGRILCGFGSAEVVNRQLISACVSFEHVTSASAWFVAFSAAGMSIGPLIAAILDSTAGRDVKIDLPLSFFPAGGIIYDHITSPAFLMAVLWFIEMMAVLLLFKEPDRINQLEVEQSEHNEDVDDETAPLNESGYGSIIPPKSSLVELTSSDASDRAFVSPPKHAGAVGDFSFTLSLIAQSPGLVVTLIIFCFIELADELLISSCTMILRRYFSLHAAAAGFMIAALGALVLPANFVVENFSHRVSERRILKASLWVILIGCFGILNYQGLYYDIIGVAEHGGFDPVNATDLSSLEIGGGVVDLTPKHEIPYNWSYGRAIYTTFLCVIFMGTIVLEGVDTSIMAQVTPPQLNSSFFNAGLLATLIGTLGRVLSDSLITTSAFLDVHVFIDFVNATFFPLVLLTIGCLILVYSFYSKLV